jgi:hypothetical protein
MKYAIDKKYDATKEHNVVFYDMGAVSSQAIRRCLCFVGLL